MKLVSLISFICGTLLLISSFMFDFTGMIGYLLTVFAIILINLGIITNKSFRHFIIDFIINII